jgi:RNA methyltransferase, TrmH family
MLSKNEAKYIQSLVHKKQRDLSGQFLVEGIKGVAELLESDFEIEKIFAVDDWHHSLAENTMITRVSEEELQKLSSLQTAHKVLALVKMKKKPEITDLTSKLILALDGIQDPGNMGTLIRIADWFGVQYIVASEDSVDWYNPKVIQSTMGSFTRVQMIYTNLLPFLKNAKMPIMGALLEGTSVYKEASIKEGILIIGNESQGISKNLRPFITAPLSIPRIGGAESLNAAVAAGILLSHLLKAN